MTYNKILGIWTASFFIIACGLTCVAITWEDHPDIAFIDHFVDFHLDTDRLVRDAQNEAESKRLSQDSYNRFVDDVYSIRNDDSCISDRGTWFSGDQ